jgi:hypothetical protein
MPSTFSPLKIQLMATGENNTTWGDVTNLNLGTALEEAIVGSADVTFASADVTLTLTDTNASQTARNMRLRCTGTTGGSTRNLIVPSIEKPYIVKNDCADSVVVKTAAGTGITVPAGKTTWVYSDATNVVDATTHLSSLTLGTDLAVSDGGTGASTLTANGVLYGSGTSAIAATAVGATGEVLVGNTGGAPSWAALTGIGVTSFSAGTTGLTPNSATTGAITLAGTLGVANGGTGATTLTSGYLVKGNGTSAVSASVVYDTGTNVGIGTASPIYLLDVRGQAGIELYDVATSGKVLNFRPSLGDANKYNMSISAFDHSGGGVGPADGLSINGFDGVSIATGSSTARQERMRITSAGLVGIGTTAPSTKLHVTRAPLTGAATRPNAVITLEDTANTELYLVSENTGNGQLRFGDTDSNYRGAVTYRHATDHMEFITAASERMRITSAGNVGIGTTSPVTKFVVSNGGAAGLEIDPNGGIGGGSYIQSYNRSTASYTPNTNFASTHTWYTGATRRMDLDASGNLGIGTSAPGSLLELSADSGPTVNLRRSGSGDGNGIIRSIGNSGTVNSAIEFGGGLSNLMGFSTNGTERMRIDSAGLVGIGNLGQPIRGNLDISLGSITTAGVERSIHFGYSTSDFYGFKLVSINSPGSFGAGTFSIQRGTTAAWVDALLVNDSGDVGIGTSSPQSRLNVDGGSLAAAAAAGILAAGSISTGRLVSGGGATLNAIHTYYDDRAYEISAGSTSGYISGIAVGARSYSGTGGDAVTVWTRSAERMRIDGSGNLLVGRTSSSGLGQIQSTIGADLATDSGNVYLARGGGNVGIGTSSPSQKLDIGGGGNVVLTGASTGDQSLKVGAGRSGNGYSFIDLQGDTTYDNGLRLIRTNGGANTSSNIEHRGTGALSLITQEAGPITFLTSATERARIDTSGNLLVGKTASSGGVNGFEANASGFASTASGTFAGWMNRKTSDGDILLFNRDATQVGSVSVTTTATAYNTSSDYRLKDIDGPISNSGTYIDALKPVQGSWKSDGSRFIGLLAHEVQEVSETSVATGVKDGEEMQAMDYSAPELIANLIAEIQSLRARVAQLEGN